DLDNPASVRAAVDQWVRVLKGDLIDKKAHETMIAEIKKLAEDDKKAAVESAKKEGIAIGKAQCPPPESNSGNSGEIDLSGWEVNGLTTEKQVGDTKIVQNYKRKA
ncbi:hypothetical protein KBC79_01540, partial [Candidatus Woesebacteria bacterium]|nr:hypothetical protein [Candidatus Woesebacteria bacterium]